MATSFSAGSSLLTAFFAALLLTAAALAEDDMGYAGEEPVGFDWQFGPAVAMLGDGLAEIEIPEGYMALGRDETQRLIETSRQLAEKSAELERAAADLRAANQRLRALDAQKDEFLSQVSHEVRTPMTSIRSFAELLLTPRDLSKAQLERFVGIIHEESLRLTRLLDEILEMNQLEHGDLQIGATPLDPNSIMERAVDTCRGLAKKNAAVLTIGERPSSSDSSPSSPCTTVGASKVKPVPEVA